MKLSTTLTVCGILGSVSALIPIEVKGNRFVRPAVDSSDDGTEFTIVGVDYQPGGSSEFDPSGSSDVLSTKEVCLRDAYVFQQLGINTIRVYAVNPWVNHDDCMSIFNAAGIYVMLDVNNPYNSLSRDKPASTYTKSYLNNVFGIIDAFKYYPNLLGFISGNEVVNDDTSAGVAPQYVRAVQRDMKEYISLHANRTIPVGYAAADVSDLRASFWYYLTCGDDSDMSKSDFYGLNSYEWCSGQSDWDSSGYASLKTQFANSSVPIMMSEYGCNAVTPRTFTEVNEGIYGPLNTTFSGGLVYEYSEETSKYGLVTIKDNGDLQLRQDFLNLQSAYNKISLASVSAADISVSSNYSCSKSTLKSYSDSFQTNWTLPECPAKSMLKNGGGNTNIGKIIDVTDTVSNYTITNVKGDEIANTSITINSNNQINSPSGKNTSEADTTDSPTTTSATASATATKKKNGSNYIEIPMRLLATGFVLTLGYISL